MTGMFNEIKAMMANEINGDDYDQQILFWADAAVLDLTETAEIVIPGTVDMEWDETTGKVVDQSDVTDKMIIGAIAIYVSMNIGNPPNHDNLLRAYESLKGQMRMASKYTRPEAVTE